jgi:multidrug efflux pump subunit AcrA (membrane-fusion protein)
MRVISSISRTSGIISNSRKLVGPRVQFVNSKRKAYSRRLLGYAERKPITAFLSLLLILLGLILLSNFINRPKETEEESRIPTKEVQVYTIGTAPKVAVQAQIEKSGVIRVVALGAGVVQSINVEVGQEVGQGANLVSMSTNYQGGNALSVGRQIAQAQLRNVKDTYKANQEIIAKQRELATKADENADEMREITNRSLESTRSLVDLNNEILTTLTDQQEQLENTNVGGANDQAILQTQQLRAQLMAGNSQLESALRNAEYAGSGEEPPAQISNLTRDVTMKQLDIQERALKLNLEVSKLNVLVAQINEAIMFPSSPVNGVVERIFVREGQAVNPGTPLVQVSGSSENLMAVALLNRELAEGVSRAQVSTIRVGSTTFESAPFYVSSEATDGQFYTAQYQIPSEFNSQLTDRGYVTIEVPVDFPKTGSSIPFIPIDSVFQTQDDAFVFTAENGKTRSKRVKLGQVLGRFVEVTSGLNDSDRVILNRNVIEGDPVKVVN